LCQNSVILNTALLREAANKPNFIAKLMHRYFIYTNCNSIQIKFRPIQICTLFAEISLRLKC